MPRNKPRLQLGLYLRPKYPGTYHYALLVSPKGSNSATKYHVKNTLQNISGAFVQPWRYECLPITDIILEQRQLVRIVIAKVAVPKELERILEAEPVYQVDDPNQVQPFTCLTWVRDALETLERKGVVAGLKYWEDIQKASLEYIERKKEVGRWCTDWKGEVGVPMLDLLDGKEIVT